MTSLLTTAAAAAQTAKDVADVCEALGLLSEIQGSAKSYASAFIDELKQLEVACSLVDECLTKTADTFDEESDLPGSSELWTIVETGVVACRGTAAQLLAALDSVEGADSDALAQTLDQITVHMSLQNLEGAQTRLHAQTSGLQLLLQVIALEVCYLYSKRADWHMRELLNRTQEHIESFDTVVGEKTAYSTAVLRLGRQALRDGEALFATTVATGSEDPAESERRGSIKAWIEDIDIVESPTTQLSLFNTDDVTSKSKTPSDQESQVREQQSFLFENEDFSDDDIYMEAAQSATEKGTRASDSADYATAYAYLSEALGIIKTLPDNQRDLCNVWNVQFMLGVAAFHARSAKEAEIALKEVLDKAPKFADLDDQIKSQIYETAHLLAQVQVTLGDLEKATNYCDYALKGRRKVLGKTSALSYESVGLMARIFELQGNSLRAEFLNSMIPLTERARLVESFQTIPLLWEPDPVLVPSYRTPLVPVPPSKSPLRVSLASQPSRAPSSQLDIHRHRPRTSTASAASQHTVASASSSVYSQEGSQPSTAPTALSTPSLSARGSGAYNVDVKRFSGRHLAPLSLDCDGTTPTNGLGSRASTHYSTDNFRLTGPVDYFGQSHYAAQDALPIFTGPAPVQDASASTLHLYPRPLQPRQQTLVSELPGNSISSSAREAPTTPSTTREIPAEDPPSYASSSEHAPTVRPRLPARRTLSFYSPESVGRESGVNISRHGTPDPVTRGRSTPKSSNVSLSGPPSPPITSKTGTVYDNFVPPSVQHPAIRRSQSSGPATPRTSETRASETRTPEKAARRLSRRISALPGSSLQRLRSRSRGPSGSSEEVLHKRRSFFEVIRAGFGGSDAPEVPALPVQEWTRLSKQDVASVKHGSLTEDAIAFWQEHLEESVLQHSTKYAFLRPAVGAKLIQGSDGLADIVYRALPNLHETMHIFVPLKKPDSVHWSLLLVSMHDGVACHYDPQDPLNRFSSEQAVERLSIVLERPLRYLNITGIPAQMHPKDSGVLVAFYTHFLIAKLQATHMSKKTDASISAKTVDVKYQRKMMLKAIEAKGAAA